MKKIIKKFWGVGLVVILLSTLFVGAVPQASAGTLTWTTQPIVYGPLVTWQLAAGTNVGVVKVAPNGTIFAIDTTAGNVVYKSTNGGLSWTPSVAVAGAVFVDMAISPSFATDNTLFVIGAGPPGQVYISVNGGISFSVLGGALTAGETGTSIAIAPNYASGIGEVMAGTQAAAAATYGNVYIWGKNGVLNWAAQGLGEDITKVAYSPNYLIDSTRLAIGSNVAAFTRLHTLIAADAGWDVTIAAISIVSGVVQGTGDGVPIIGSSIVFPSDFNASLAITRTCWVGLNSGSAVDNVYRVIVGVAASTAIGPPAWWAPDFAAGSLAYNGTTAAGTLYFGDNALAAVLSNASPGAPGATAIAAWAPNLKGPSGAGPTSIALAIDFATSLTIYAGTAGTPESAFSVSTDGGWYFNQYGLIDTAILNINDFAAANATTFFMVTSDGVNISVWKTTTAGASWYRVYNVASALTGIIRLSPNFATDNTVFFGVVTSLLAGNIQMSTNAGTSWTARTSPIAVGDIAVKDMYSIYVASSAAGAVQATANGGWTWQPAATAIAGFGALVDIKYNVATGHIMVGDLLGLVAISTNSNISYLALAAGGAIGAVAAPAVVAFDTNYATNNIIYAAVNAGGNGIWRYTVGTSTTWGVAPIDGGLMVAARDIILAPDGTLYASDFTAAAAAAGGVVRIMSPTAIVPASVELITASVAGVGDGLAVGDTLSALSMAQGSNVLYAVNNIAIPNVRTFTDSIAMGSAAPVQTAPADDEILAAAAAVFMWDAVPGALFYQVRYAIRSDWVGQVIVASVNAFDTVVASGALVAGSTYNWQVRVSVPVFGPWSETRQFVAQLVQVALNAPVQLAVVVNAAGTTSLTPTLAWVANKAATGYELEVYTDAAMTDKVVDATGANALGAVNVYTVAALDYSTTYYWRVRAITAAATTDWSGLATFTTMDVAVEPTTIVIPTQEPAPTPTIILPTPTVTVNVPPVTQPAEEVVNPTYIWAIIIIGAVLVIAVIVLIVRTRRSV